MRKLLFAILIVFTCSVISGCSRPQGSGYIQNPVITPVENHPQDNNVAPQKNEKDELDSRAKEILSSLTVEEKIGQLLIVGFPQGTEDSELMDYIARYKVGGFILFKRNYTDFEALYRLTKKLKGQNAEKNPLPLFISADEEGGTVSRLPKGGTKFPDAQVLGKIDNTDLTYKTGEIIGEEFMASGINLDFAPVLDIVSSPENKLLIRRSYGSTPEAVSRHGIAFINGLRAKGVIASAKHFPGHGDTNVDSHGKLPVINIDKSTLYSRELVPFKSSIDAGLDALMVGHLSYPKLDPELLPATMSSYFLTDLLRKEWDFQGITISDEIEMYGYMSGKQNLEECVLTSFNSGLDVFVIGHTKKIQDRVLNALTTGVKEGKISKERLDESVLRIIKLKLKYKLSDKMEYSLEEAQMHFGSKDHKEILGNIDACILKTSTD